MYKAIKIDENCYFTGTYMEGTNKELLELNGIIVEEFPEEEDKDLWKAYRFKNNKWEKDEIKHKELKDKKKNDTNNEEIYLQLNEIKKELSDLDYHTMKYIEGEYTEEEFEVYKEKKKELRKKYNNLEKELR